MDVHTPQRRMENAVTAFVFLALTVVLTWPLPAGASTPAGAGQARPAARQPPAPGARDPAIQKPEAPAAPVQTASPPAPSSAYRIGLQDELKITVFDEADLSNTYRVDSDGFITFPLIGRVGASGVTLAELAARITAMLANGFIRSPQVRVDINQYKSQFVYVIGEVRSPGKITMTGSTMTLLEALAQAGSPTANASNEVIVVHPSRPNSSAAPTPDEQGTRITVNRKDLELGKVGQDIALEDGDIINVPVAQRFYVNGHVRTPGFYVLDPGMTVQQAIALAGGLSDRGSDRRLTITRLVNGKIQDVKVDLGDKIQANDTVNIPSRFF